VPRRKLEKVRSRRLGAEVQKAGKEPQMGEKGLARLIVKGKMVTASGVGRFVRAKRGEA